jgi:hypothetical protein
MEQVIHFKAWFFTMHQESSRIQNVIISASLSEACLVMPICAYVLIKWVFCGANNPNGWWLPNYSKGAYCLAYVVSTTVHTAGRAACCVASHQ